MSFESMPDAAREPLLHWLYQEQKKHLENPAVKNYMDNADLIRRLEKNNPQLSLSFQEEKPKLKKNGSARIVRYKDINKNVISVLVNLNDVDTGRWDYLDTITDQVAELYQVSGKKTIAHLKTCVQAFLNKKNPQIEINADANNKRIYRLTPSK
jgi:hypothetical protein